MSMCVEDVLATAKIEHMCSVGESVVLLAAGSAGCTADNGAGAGSGEAGSADARHGW